jgi:hypothetical protein
MLFRTLIASLLIAAAWVLFSQTFTIRTYGPMETPQDTLFEDQQMLNKMIRTYRQEHHGRAPRMALFMQQLSGYTDAAGNPSPSKDETHYLGPYIKQLPRLPLGPNKGSSTVGPEHIGWIYNEATGEIRGNCDQPD